MRVAARAGRTCRKTPPSSRCWVRIPAACNATPVDSVGRLTQCIPCRQFGTRIRARASRLTRPASRSPKSRANSASIEADIVKLASNENPLGHAGVGTAGDAGAAAADIGRYPDANGFALKAALAAKYDVPADWITLGNGSNDILELAAHAFVQPGESMRLCRSTRSPSMRWQRRRVGARGIEVPAEDYGHDLDAMARGDRRRHPR